MNAQPKHPAAQHALTWLTQMAFKNKLSTLHEILAAQPSDDIRQRCSMTLEAMLTADLPKPTDLDIIALAWIVRDGLNNLSQDFKCDAEFEIK